jgi:hypothetical protein
MTFRYNPGQQWSAGRSVYLTAARAPVKRTGYRLYCLEKRR